MCVEWGMTVVRVTEGAYSASGYVPRRNSQKKYVVTVKDLIQESKHVCKSLNCRFSRPTTRQGCYM